MIFTKILCMICMLRNGMPSDLVLRNDKSHPFEQRRRQQDPRPSNFFFERSTPVFRRSWCAPHLPGCAVNPESTTNHIIGGPRSVFGPVPHFERCFKKPPRVATPRCCCSQSFSWHTAPRCACQHYASSVYANHSSGASKQWRSTVDPGCCCCESPATALASGEARTATAARTSGGEDDKRDEGHG